MSNNVNPVEFDVVPYTGGATELSETQATDTAPKKNTAATRLFAFLLLAICAAALFCPIQVLKNNYVPTETTLWAAVIDLFTGNETAKLFNLLPVFTSLSEPSGVLANAAFYALLAAIALTALFALIALLSGKSGMFRTAAFCFATGFGTYAVCGYALPTIKDTAIGFDWFTLGLAAAGALLYLVLGFAKKGKKEFASLIQLLFSLAFTAAIIIPINAYTDDIADAIRRLHVDVHFAYIVQTLVGVLWGNLLLGTIRLQTKKGLGLDIVRYLVQLILGAAFIYVVYVAKIGELTPLLYAVGAAVVSLVQTIMCVIQMTCCKKQEEELEPEMDAELTPEPVSLYTAKEYGEALPYDGGPVESVEFAHEVPRRSEEKQKPIEPSQQVNTNGYDFYNSKSFDPFIALLNNEERNQFTELFILKYKGVMPEIPDYQVGGDNKDFFRKLFIYLGQYRDRIPDSLLAKIYQYSIRNV
ncbi:MAG: hypothetical protein IJX96_01635 [Clostridia bacterium]|nr:hypothetical protein [Clostridia bacterium]